MPSKKPPTRRPGSYSPINFKKKNRPIPKGSRRSGQINVDVQLVTLDTRTHMTFSDATARSARAGGGFNRKLANALIKIIDAAGGRPEEVPLVKLVRGIQNYRYLKEEKTFQPFAGADFFMHNNKPVPGCMQIPYKEMWVVASVDDLRGWYRAHKQTPGKKK